MKQAITSEMIDFANLRDLVKMYEKPSTSKSQHALDDGDANTIIFQQVLNEATKKNFIVHCIDTDVFIVLLYHFDTSENSVVMTTKQGLCSIEKVVSALDDDLRQCLLISHALSVCNTVSATFGIGKLKDFNKFTESSYWKSAIKTVCDEDIEIDRVVEKVVWKGCGKSKVTRSSTQSNVQFTEVYTNNSNTTNKSSILLS